MPTIEKQDLIFEDIVIRFTRQIYYGDERTFQLEVRQSPGPLPGGAFRTDIASEVQRFQQHLTQRVKMSQFFSRFESPNTETHTVTDLGRQLYGLLPLAFRQALPRLVQSILEQGKALRLILEVQAGDKADQLLGLPWELLFLDKTEVFLTHSPRVVVVRRLLGAMRRSQVQIHPPFNILHIVAHSATSSKAYWIDAALQDAERDAIRRADRPGLYHCVEAPGSVEQMLTALREQSYHVVHFLGHGEVHHSDNTPLPERGYLRFVSNDNDATQWVTGEQLQYWLDFSPTVQLVVLNACHGGTNVARSVAFDLIYHGLPYVVAIQGDFLQEAARHFAKAFYTELQRGSSVEYAVAVGRAAIATNLPTTIDWCLPVLYTSVGLPELSDTRQRSERLWQWMSAPYARKYLGIGNLVFGGLHLSVGLLLLVSRHLFPLPSYNKITWLIAILISFPVLLLAVFYHYTPTTMPKNWPLASRLALGIRVLEAASIGFGLPILYTWFTLLLLLGLGFWNVLTTATHTILLGLVFIPGVLWGWRLGYSQMLGHARAFISSADIEPPTLMWDELIVLLGALTILLLPWIILAVGKNYITPPWGNLWVGGTLSMIGYLLWQERTKTTD